MLSIRSHDLGKAINGVLEWADYINLIDGGDPIKQLNKIAEEVEEYSNEICLEDYDKAEVELGDVFVTCIVSAEQNGIDLIKALQRALIKINKRKDSGRMVNGIFTKAEDL
jgi:hypothetical protein